MNGSLKGVEMRNAYFRVLRIFAFLSLVFPMFYFSAYSAATAPAIATDEPLSDSPADSSGAENFIHSFIDLTEHCPVFILYFDQGNLDAMELWLKRAINEEDLFGALNLKKNDNKCFIFKFSSRSLPDSGGNKMSDVITIAKSRRCQIVMIAGGDKGGGFIDLTNEGGIGDNTFYSAILFDPKVGTGISEGSGEAGIVGRAWNWTAKKVNNAIKAHSTIDYRTIETAVYNFYSTALVWRGTRKVGPGTNGIVDNRTKFFNVRCREQENEDKDKDCLSNYDINFPQIINKINGNFIINSDLMCVAKAVGDDYHGEMIPLVFVNRPIEIDGFALKNRQEAWTFQILPLVNNMDELTERLKDELVRDEIEKSKFVKDGKCVSPTVSEIYAHEQTGNWSISRILGLTRPDDTVELVSSFVVPCAPTEFWEQKYAVVIFLRSGMKDLFDKFDRSSLDQKFKVMSNDGEELTDITKYGAFLGRGRDGYFYYMVKAIITGYPNRVTKFEPIWGQNGFEYIKATVAPIETAMSNDFSFVVCGDVQKQNPEWPHESDHSGSAAKYFSEVYREIEGNDKENPAVLNLIVGDLVQDGSNIVDWGHILGTYIGSISQNKLIATAIGTHDFASSSVTLWLSFLGLSTKTAFGWKFGPTIPTFGHLFCFTETPNDVDANGNLQPNRHVEHTQGWFDIGRVRFIHLPLATEEVNTYGDEAGYSDLLLDRMKYIVAGGFWFNFNIADEFLRNLADAAKDKNEDKLDFIIVYGHAPLVSAPNRHLHHKGLFNSLFLNSLDEPRYANKKALAERLLPEIMNNADAYFCGHNHVYDRCILTGNGRAIPMVTIGLGTKLRRSDLTSHAKSIGFDGYKIESVLFIDSNSLKNSPNADCYKGNHNQFLPAYLKCNIRGGADHPFIDCRLISKSGANGKVELDLFEIHKGQEPTSVEASGNQSPDLSKSPGLSRVEAVRPEPYLPQPQMISSGDSTQSTGTEIPAAPDLLAVQINEAELPAASAEPQDSGAKSQVLSTFAPVSTEGETPFLREVESNILPQDRLMPLVEAMAFNTGSEDATVKKLFNGWADKALQILKNVHGDDVANLEKYLSGRNAKQLKLLDLIIGKIDTSLIDRIVFNAGHFSVYERSEVKDDPRRYWIYLLNEILSKSMFGNKNVLTLTQTVAKHCSSRRNCWKTRWLWARYYLLKRRGLVRAPEAKTV